MSRINVQAVDDSGERARAVQTHNRCMTPQTALDGLYLLKGTGEARATVICQRTHKVPVGPIN